MNNTVGFFLHTVKFIFPDFSLADLHFIVPIRPIFLMALNSSYSSRSSKKLSKCISADNCFATEIYQLYGT